MTSFAYFELAVATQIALGAGYLAYSVAYAGLRDGHKGTDAFFITVGFSAVASLIFASSFGATGSPVAASAITFVITVVVAGLWRKLLRGAALWGLGALRIHREDGISSGWATILQSDHAVSQASVHLKDGRVLYLNDRAQYRDAPWQGLYLGSDGAVVMVVEEEEFPDGTEEMRLGVKDAGWGTRLTFIPPSEIARVNLRMKP